MPPPGVPAVPVFPAGYGPQAADFTGWVTTPFTFCSTKVVFRAQRQAALALGANVFTIVPWDTILEDPYSGWNAGTSTWAPPAGCSGWYEITMTAFAANPANATTLLEAAVNLNGTLYQEMSAGWGVNGHAMGSCGSVILPLTGGFDALSWPIFTSTAVNTVPTAGQYPTVEIAWISA